MMRITWDELKRLSNLDKHGLDFADIDSAFLLRANVMPAAGDRLKFVGTIGDTKVVVVIAAMLGQEAISIISLRRANRKERKVYGAQT